MLSPKNQPVDRAQISQPAQFILLTDPTTALTEQPPPPPPLWNQTQLPPALHLNQSIVLLTPVQLRLTHPHPSLHIGPTVVQKPIPPAVAAVPLPVTHLLSQQPQGGALAAYPSHGHPGDVGYPYPQPQALAYLQPQSAGPSPALTQLAVAPWVTSSHIEAPSFPYSVHDDPLEFTMLKMALFNLFPQEAHEQYKYHILLNHLKLETARQLALAYAHSPHPYTCAFVAFSRNMGCPIT